MKKQGLNKYGCTPSVWKKLSPAGKKGWRRYYKFFLRDLEEARRARWTDDVLAHNYACLMAWDM